MIVDLVELTNNNKVIVNIDEYHLVYGVDESLYGMPSFHVACYSDLEDGHDGDFHWYTEAGDRITSVTHISKEPLPVTP